MQFTSMIAAATLACTALALPEAVPVAKRNSGSVTCCNSGGSSWTGPNSSGQCPGGEGSTYSCSTNFQLLAVLNCVNLLDGDTVEVPLSLLSGITLNL